MPPSALPPLLGVSARGLRLSALGLSCGGIAFALTFGVFIRRAIAMGIASDHAIPVVLTALLALLAALLLRMGASLCELMWLERVWSSLPAAMRVVGPVKDVSSGMLIALSFIPLFSWLWKLGLVTAIARGLEQLRAGRPAPAAVTPIPRRLGMTAVIVGWIPGLNVYIAPFLWELFATRIERVLAEVGTTELAGDAATPA